MELLPPPLVIDNKDAFLAYQDCFVSTKTNSENTISFSFELTHFVNAREIFLAIPTQTLFLNMRINRNDKADNPPIRTNGLNPPLIDTTADGNVFKNLTNWNCGIWNGLQLFDNVNISAGTNSIRVGSPEGINKPGLITEACFFPFIRKYYKILAGLGQPVAVTNAVGVATEETDVTVDSNPKNGFNTNQNKKIVNLNREYSDAVDSYWSDLYYTSLKQSNNLFSNKPINNQILSNKYYTYVPLGFINSFFNVEGYLSKGLKLKLDIMYNKTFTMYNLTPYKVPNAVYTVTTPSISQSVMKGEWYIFYRGIYLPPTIEKTFIQEKYNRPLQYFKSDQISYIMSPNGLNTEFKKIIQVGEKFPTQIIIFPFRESPTNSVATQINYFKKDTSKLYPIVTWDRNILPFKIFNLKISTENQILYFNSMNMLDLADNTNYLYTNGISIRRPFDILTEIENQNAYWYDEGQNQTTASIRTEEVYPFVVTLDANFPQEDKISVSTEPTTLTIEGFFTDPENNPLPATTRIRVICRSPTSTGIFGTGKVIEAKYPNDLKEINSGNYMEIEEQSMNGTFNN